MKLYLALPALNEAEYLPELMSCLKNQTLSEFELFVCVNQPDDWWENPEKIKICENNQASLQFLKEECDFTVHIIDRFSKGKGWKGKHFGVGWARKTAMDAISDIARPEDIIISIDADTYYPPEYFASVKDVFMRNPDKIALSNPYYHKLTGDENLDRAILRYEIYMRNYSLNMHRINNPYNFTALGSAIAVPVWAYRKIGGITPHKSGEDFYFLQKLRKSGELILWNDVKVYPSARKSERVFFGTGPAVIKGLQGNWDSYPIYHYSLFDQVHQTYNLFKELFKNDFSVPMYDFLKSVFKEKFIWQALRDNSANARKFADACMQKVDALRILQYIKFSQNKLGMEDEFCLKENLALFNQNYSYQITIPENISFSNSDLRTINKLRDSMVEMEDHFQSMN